MQLPTVTDVRAWIQRNKGWIVLAPRSLGPSWVAIQVVGGLSIMTALLGFLTANPALAMVLTVVFFYYGLRGWEIVEARWRRETIDHKITVQAVDAKIERVGENYANVICDFWLTNHCDFDIYFMIDDERYSIGDSNAKEPPTAAVQIIPARTRINQHSDDIRVPYPITTEFLSAKLTTRYGRRKDKLLVRWFVAIEIYMSAKERGLTDGPNRSGYVLKRNDFEWIST